MKLADDSTIDNEDELEDQADEDELIPLVEEDDPNDEEENEDDDEDDDENTN